MWWFKLYPYLLVPCAALAGLFTWSFTRGRAPSDGELLKNFVIALAMLLMLSAGISRTEFARSRWDEGYQARVSYLGWPVHAALREHRPEEWKQMEAVAVRAFDELVPPQLVFAQTRMHYLGLARRMMESAQDSAVLAYAQALVPVLEELRTSDPKACVRMAWQHAGGEPFDVSPKLSAAVNEAYERAVARLVAQNATSAKSASEWKPEPRAGLAEVRAAVVELVEPIRARHGVGPEELMSRGVAQLDPAAACGATIAFFQGVLAADAIVARTLFKQVL